VRDQRGVTVFELLIVVAIVSVAVTVTVVYSTPWMVRESMRGAANHVSSFMQLTKIEAVSRNRDCRFLIDVSKAEIEIWDSLGSDDVSDDVRLHRSSIPSHVSFARPDSGDVITLDPVAPSVSYQTVFTSDGLVSDGVGGVYLHGGETFGSILVHAAGGVEIRYWNGTAWREGS